MKDYVCKMDQMYKMSCVAVPCRRRPLMPAFFGFVPGRSRFGWARVRRPRALGTEERELVRARPKRTHPPDPPNRPRWAKLPPSLTSPGAPRASSRLGDEARLRSLWAGQKGAPGLDVSWVSANWRPFWAHPLVERVPVFAERRRLRSSTNGLVIALLESDSRGNSQHAEPLGISQWGLGGAATASFRGWAGVRGARKACSGRWIPFGPPLRGPAPQPPPAVRARVFPNLGGCSR